MSEEKIKKIKADLVELDKLVAKLISEVGEDVPMLKKNLENIMAIVTYIKYSLGMDVESE